MNGLSASWVDALRAENHAAAQEAVDRFEAAAKREGLSAEHRIIERPPNGLGDLTAAVYLARLMAGQQAAKALQSTTASVFEILARTAKRGGGVYGVCGS